MDPVAQYAGALGLSIRTRTVLVEGTTDVALFYLAARLERKEAGVDLLGDDLAIVAGGERERGGTHGVIRELIALRGMARTCLLPNGRPRYRFVGLFDNDRAGKEAVRLARTIDSSILEYKDVFRLWPVMPSKGNLDPGTLKKTFERQNAEYKQIEWELEDLLTSDFVDAFLAEHPGALIRSTLVGNRVHRDLTVDGKARFHRFVEQYAEHGDMRRVIEVLRAIRFYLNLQ